MSTDTRTDGSIGGEKHAHPEIDAGYAEIEARVLAHMFEEDLGVYTTKALRFENMIDDDLEWILTKTFFYGGGS